MGIMKKLLDTSFKAFLSYAAIVLACSIPAYYAIVDLIWQNELKEHNLIVSTGVRKQLEQLPLSDTALEESIRLWNLLQPERQLKQEPGLKADSTYNIYRVKAHAADRKKDRFQGLVTYFELKGHPYSLRVETNMEESHETLLGLAVVSLIFFILLFAGLIVLNRRMSARIWQPFYKTLHTIQHFNLDHQQSVSFVSSGILEFEALNGSLDKLIKDNIAVYQQQKHFIENASHELQTPLAIVQSKLDLLLQDHLLTGRQSEIIDQIQAALSRVNRVNKNLLLLAKIENNQFPRTEPFNLSLLVADSLSLLDVLADEKKMVLNQEITPDVLIDTNRTLAEILLTNLLFNAVRYTPEGGTVLIELSPERLRVSNTGHAALDREQLFERFGNVAADVPGTGLGLAIVRQICYQNKWQIAYDFTESQHHFTIRFS